MRSAARQATIALAVAALAVRAGADDPAAKPAAPPKLTLRPAPETTYLYRCTETVALEVDFGVKPPPDAPAALVDRPRPGATVETVWDVGLVLADVTETGELVVSLLPTRVHGRVAFTGRPTKTFDSDDPKSTRTSPFVGHAIRVKLSPSGRVLEAVGPGAADLAKDLPEDVRALVLKVSPDGAAEFAERFFQELPADPPKAALSWESARSLAPELCDPDGVPSLEILGEVTEKATVTKVGPAAVAATIVSRGRRRSERADAPITLSDDPLKNLADLRPRLEEWFVSGDVELDRATGLVRTRTTTAHVAAHRSAVQLPKDAKPPTGLPFQKPAAEPVTTPPSDETYDVTTKLEALTSK